MCEDQFREGILTILKTESMKFCTKWKFSWVEQDFEAETALFSYNISN